MPGRLPDDGTGMAESTLMKFELQSIMPLLAITDLELDNNVTIAKSIAIASFDFFFIVFMNLQLNVLKIIK